MRCAFAHRRVRVQICDSLVAIDAALVDTENLNHIMRDARELSAAVGPCPRQRDRDDHSLIARHGVSIVVPVRVLA